MTDRELLEAAARAAGWAGWQSKHGYWNVTNPDGESSTRCYGWPKYSSVTGEKMSEPTFADALNESGWNPLSDDGDALRLAVKLGLLQHTKFGPSMHPSVNSWRAHYLEPHATAPAGIDPCAATRRAIVRAAAEIGKTMS